MTLATPLLLSGAPGSPYTRKMLAVLRYRHIPYRFLLTGHNVPESLPKPKVALLPTFYLQENGGAYEAAVDSTPLIRRFEKAFAGRHVVPADPVVEFIDYLLEDYADEWLTKAMFHYRWHYKADIERAAAILPLWRDISASDEMLTQMSKLFSERQISRLYVVGSNETTAPVIEASYQRFLDAMTAHLKNYPFLMGGRPGGSDFGVFGQLTQLTHFDPTPMAETIERSPRVFAWVDIMEDLSGLEPGESDWVQRNAIPETMRGLLREVGRVYAPALLANAKALAAGSDKVETEIDGKPWVQQPFPYQAKCLQWLREKRDAMVAGDRRIVDDVLAGTGVDVLFR